MSKYEQMKREAQQLQASTEPSRRLTAEERADWAFGNAVIENPKVTREMAKRAVESQRDRGQR